VQSASTGVGNPDNISPNGAASEPPDVSPEFQSEMAAIRGYYAARIAAARRSLTGSVAAAIVQSLLNEQTVALRALTDRWRAATERQKQEKPQRPAGNAQRKDGGIKPS
jgi:hypothetical protein